MIDKGGSMFRCDGEDLRYDVCMWVGKMEGKDGR